MDNVAVYIKDADIAREYAAVVTIATMRSTVNFFNLIIHFQFNPFFTRYARFRRRRERGGADSILEPSESSM